MLNEVILDRLQLIVEQAAVIGKRIIIVNKSWHTIGPDEKSVLIDSLIFRLQGLSENIKKIEKLEIILAICKKDVPHLSNTIQTYLRKLE
jgi:hypothetical protein